MKKIETLVGLVKPFYSTVDPAHDWAHIKRVATNALFLVSGHTVSIECVLAAVYCHDLVNLPKNHPERAQASTLAAEKARPLLEEAGFEAKEIEIIQTAIISHSFSKGLKPSSLEGEIVQDADRLDALGAVGILRCAAVNTRMKSSFYETEDPLAQNRQLDDKKFMLDHYFVKLFKLPELMNTLKAKEEANKRVSFMKNFVSEFMSEIS